MHFRHNKILAARRDLDFSLLFRACKTFASNDCSLCGFSSQYIGYACSIQSPSSYFSALLRNLCCDPSVAASGTQKSAFVWVSKTQVNNEKCSSASHIFRPLKKKSLFTELLTPQRYATHGWEPLVQWSLKGSIMLLHSAHTVG